MAHRQWTWLLRWSNLLSWGFQAGMTWTMPSSGSCYIVDSCFFAITHSFPKKNHAWYIVTCGCVLTFLLHGLLVFSESLRRHTIHIVAAAHDSLLRVISHQRKQYCNIRHDNRKPTCGLSPHMCSSLNSVQPPQVIHLYNPAKPHRLCLCLGLVNYTIPTFTCLWTLGIRGPIRLHFGEVCELCLPNDQTSKTCSSWQWVVLSTSIIWLWVVNWSWLTIFFKPTRRRWNTSALSQPYHTHGGHTSVKCGRNGLNFIRGPVWSKTETSFSRLHRWQSLGVGLQLMAACSFESEMCLYFIVPSITELL